MGIAIQECQSGQRRQVPPIVQSRVNRWPLRSDAKHAARTGWEPNQRYRSANAGSLAKPGRPLCRDSGRRQANCRYIFGSINRRSIAAGGRWPNANKTNKGQRFRRQGHRGLIESIIPTMVDRSVRLAGPVKLRGVPGARPEDGPAV